MCKHGEEDNHIRPLLTIVAPVYNEEAVLPEFHSRLSAVLDQMSILAEVLYVNDGSTDTTLMLIKEWLTIDNRVSLIDLSRNFGKEVAMTAGLDYARGKAVIVIDTDLQDPPELIPKLMQQWHEGYDVVYAQRLQRDGETWFKKATAHYFYRLIDKLSHIYLPPDTGDFRLLSERAVNALRQIREHHRFMKGLFAWIGFSQIAVPYRRERRYAGKSKWNYWKLWNFALEGITAFTTLPLKLATYFGLLIASLSFVYAVFIFGKVLLYGDPVRGYPSLMVAILFLGGVQLMTLGVIGEYIGRMFNETKRRPLYFVKYIAGAICFEPRRRADSTKHPFRQR